VTWKGFESKWSQPRRVTIPAVYGRTEENHEHISQVRDVVANVGNAKFLNRYNFFTALIW
jgi:hypothetical protein